MSRADEDPSLAATAPATPEMLSGRRRWSLAGRTLRYLSECKVPAAAPDLASPAPQAPNRAQVWSKRQRPREAAIQGPRFVGVDMAAQPRPPAAIELLRRQPIAMVQARTVECDGGGLLGHPNVFINLDDTGKPSVCGYCGKRFQQDTQHKH